MGAAVGMDMEQDGGEEKGDEADEAPAGGAGDMTGMSSGKTDSRHQSFRGVTWNTHRQMWRVQVCLAGGWRQDVGYYLDEAQGAAAYSQAFEAAAYSRALQAVAHSQALELRVSGRCGQGQEEEEEEEDQVGMEEEEDESAASGSGGAAGTRGGDGEQEGKTDSGHQSLHGMTWHKIAKQKGFYLEEVQGVAARSKAQVAAARRIERLRARDPRDLGLGDYLQVGRCGQGKEEEDAGRGCRIRQGRERGEGGGKEVGMEEAPCSVPPPPPLRRMSLPQILGSGHGVGAISLLEYLHAE